MPIIKPYINFTYKFNFCGGHKCAVLVKIGGHKCAKPEKEVKKHITFNNI